MPGQFDTDVDPVIPTVTPEEAGLSGGEPVAAVATLSFPIECTTRMVPLAVGEVHDWMVSYPISVQKITASLTEASVNGDVAVDVKRNGTSVFSTTISIDEGDVTSLTAAVQSSISDMDWSEGDIMTVHITSAGDGASGLKIYATTGAQAVDTNAPEAPTNLTATADGSATIDLAWDAADDDFGVVAYRIQRATASNFSGALSTTVGNVTSYSMTGLSPETTYYFRIAAKDAANNQSAWSNAANDTTSGFDPQTDVAWLGYHDAEELALSNGANVTSFTDQSGNANHGVPDTGDGQTNPTFATAQTELNSKKAVVMDADTEGVLFPWGASGECTVFLVGYFEPSGSAWQNLLGNGLNTWRVLTNTSGEYYFDQSSVVTANGALAAGKYIIRIEHAAATTKMFINGVEVTDDDTHTTKPGDTYLGKVGGGSPGFTVPGYVGIAACSDGLLTGTDADACEAVWAAYYGITLP